MCWGGTLLGVAFVLLPQVGHQDLRCCWQGTASSPSPEGLLGGLQLERRMSPERNQVFQEVSNLQPIGHMHPRIAVNVAQHKIVNLHKT